MRTDVVLFLVIYLTTLVALLSYNISHPPINDGVKEYETYLLNIQDGWEYRRTLVNSSLVTTWLPALVQGWTGWDTMTVFRIFPPIFYALMPAFTYLIARRYLTTGLAVAAALLVLVNSHILFFPDLGRVGVGVAFLSGMIWALLNKKLWWAMGFAVLVVFSHYGTSLIALGIAVVCVAGYLIWRRRLLKQYLVVACLLLVAVGTWHFWVASYSGWVMLTYGIQQDIPEITGDVVGPAHGLGTEAWFDIESRETAVQRAIGLGGDVSAPEAIEIVANWIGVLTTSLGLIVLLRNKNIEDVIKIMGLSLWLLIVFTVAVPWLSLFYGGMRVYFTALPVLAVCFVLGAKKLASWIRVPPLVVCGMVLVLLAVSSSGVIYLPFGLEKTIPVYFSIGE
jgi:hypothetical protein